MKNHIPAIVTHQAWYGGYDLTGVCRWHFAFLMGSSIRLVAASA
jgi:hypothetical protein